MAEIKLAISLTESMATYMQKKFLGNIKDNSEPIAFPKEWDLELLYECDLAAHVLGVAFRNQSECIFRIGKKQF